MANQQRIGSDQRPQEGKRRPSSALCRQGLGCVLQPLPTAAQQRLANRLTFLLLLQASDTPLEELLGQRLSRMPPPPAAGQRWQAPAQPGPAAQSAMLRLPEEALPLSEASGPVGQGQGHAK